MFIIRKLLTLLYCIQYSIKQYILRDDIRVYDLHGADLLVEGEELDVNGAG